MFYLHIKLGCPKIYSQCERAGGVRIGQTRNESVNDGKLLVFSTHTSHSPRQPTACFIDYLISWMSKGKITFISAQRRKASSEWRKEREREKKWKELHVFFRLASIYVNDLWMQSLTVFSRQITQAAICEVCNEANSVSTLGQTLTHNHTYAKQNCVKKQTKGESVFCKANLLGLKPLAKSLAHNMPFHAVGPIHNFPILDLSLTEQCDAAIERAAE